MVTLDDARRIALALPGASEGISRDTAHWSVGGKTFVWERPLRKKEQVELGDSAPEGTILGAHVADEGEKRALVTGEPDLFFTTKHFDGYPAVLIPLDRVDVHRLREVIAQAWRARAPRSLADGHPEL